jgi:hypothetical protein
VAPAAVHISHVYCSPCAAQLSTRSPARAQVARTTVNRHVPAAHKISVGAPFRAMAASIAEKYINPPFMGANGRGRLLLSADGLLLVVGRLAKAADVTVPLGWLTTAAALEPENWDLEAVPQSAGDMDGAC